MAEEKTTSKTAPKSDSPPVAPTMPNQNQVEFAPPEAQPIPIDEPAPVSPPPVAPIEPKSFFEDFESSAKSKKIRYFIFILFGLFVVGLLYLLKPVIESYFKPTPSLEETYNPVSTEPKSMHLDISNPDDELLTFDKTVNISGKTSPKSSVVISNGDLNWGVDADVAGEFSKVIDLKTGLNNVTIFAFDPQGNNKTETRTIYYSEEKI